MRFIYDALFFIFSLLYLPSFFLKGKHRDGFGSRFGRIDSEVKHKLFGRRVFWVHAVSVGEVVQAVRLINVLRENLSQTVFVLTTTTHTGNDIARKLKNPEDILLYFPVDYRFAVRSFVDSIKPEALVILETEIWPNLIFELSKRKIPVFIVNGRLSDKAFLKYKKIKNFVKIVLNKLEGIFVQDELMRSRFLELGAPAQAVSVTGNMKFDWTPRLADDAVVERLSQVKNAQKYFLLVAGSTHEGEEAALFKIIGNLQSKIPGLRLILAPRHLERMNGIEAAATAEGLVVKKYSEALALNGGPHAVFDGGSILLIDKMGVLAGMYQAADIVFVGGSLVDRGGHNLVEPAFFEKAVLFGPHMSNFREMVKEFKAAKAALEIENAQDLEKRIFELYQDPAGRNALGVRARKLVFSHQGATQKNAQAIISIFSARFMGALSEIGI